MTKQFQKSDYVAYGNSGVCLIEDIQALSFSYQKQASSYYILKPIGNRTETIFVPCGNEKLVSKMRPALTKPEIDALLQQIQGKELDWIEDKNARAVSFHSILSKGNQRELLQLANCIYLQKQEKAATGKKLPQSDETVLRSVEKLIGEEFSFSLHLPESQVSDYIQNHLQREAD